MIKTSQAEIENNIIDIDLSAIKKKRFRINGDNDLIIELNTSDMGIVNRINDALPKLNALQDKAAKLGVEVEGEDLLASSAKTLKSIDKEMRELVDFIFDADVSSKCAKDGSMYDLLDGSFRYEIILEKLTSLYAERINMEYKKLKQRVNKYAKK